MFLLTTINCPPYKQILNYKIQELGLSLTNGIVALIIIVALLASLTEMSSLITRKKKA